VKIYPVESSQVPFGLQFKSFTAFSQESAVSLQVSSVQPIESEQFLAAPEQTPEPSQASAVVQNNPSSQLVPSVKYPEQSSRQQGFAAGSHISPSPESTNPFPQ